MKRNNPQPTLHIKVETGPLLLFLELLEAALKIRECPIDLSDIGFELARVETDNSAAGTGELSVVFYPSDSFLRFAATALARN